MTKTFEAKRDKCNRHYDDVTQHSHSLPFGKAELRSEHHHMCVPQKGSERNMTNIRACRKNRCPKGYK